MKIFFSKNGKCAFFYCPSSHSYKDGAGRNLHRIPIPRWTFTTADGKVSMSPSMNESSNLNNEHPRIPGYRCHFTITNDMLSFCSDCTHELANKTMELPDLTEEQIGEFRRWEDYVD